MNPITFPYLPMRRGSYPSAPSPLLPARVTFAGVTIPVTGLADSGALISVLPLTVGVRFGVPWNSVATTTLIGGVGGGVAAKVITATGVVGAFPPVPMIFAWAASDDVPTVFGYVNFFLEFDVCFFATRGEFTVAPRTP